MKNKKAIILLSGGIDSATCLLIAKEQNFMPYCLTFYYKQKHSIEIKSAKKVAKKIKVAKHKLIKLNISDIISSALTSNIEVPKGRIPSEMKDIPPTYVPARNTIFLSFALAWAETINAENIFIGVNNIDFSGYPDCRPEYIRKFEELANIATKAGVENKAHYKIHAPLLFLSKAEIIKLAHQKGLDFSLTHSCYDPLPDGRACGMCDSCILRLKGFIEAGINDPIVYANKIF